MKYYIYLISYLNIGATLTLKLYFKTELPVPIPYVLDIFKQFIDHKITEYTFVKWWNSLYYIKYKDIFFHPLAVISCSIPVGAIGAFISLYA